MWYPGATPPEHLDGSMPADYGFDPFFLGIYPDALKWFREGELYNGRICMFAVPGMILPELAGLPPWYEAGQAQGPLPNGTLLLIELAVWAVFEYKRYENFKKVGVTGLLGFAPFDPLGLNTPYRECAEIKNGRLAMLAFVGIVVQSVVQNKGPVGCLKAHLADPVNNNLFTSWLAPGFLVLVNLFFVIPFFKELQIANFGRSEEEINQSLFLDTRYKRAFNYGIALAPFAAIAWIAQFESGLEAYKAAGL